jgi:hypothetical protein
MFAYALRDDVGRYAFYVDADDLDSSLTGWHFDYYGEMRYSLSVDILMSYDTALNVQKEIGGKIVVYQVSEY